MAIGFLGSFIDVSSGSGNRGYAGSYLYGTEASSSGPPPTPGGGASNRQFPTAISLRAFPTDAQRAFPTA